MVTRILINEDPFLSFNQDKPWREQGHWPCSWVSCPGAGQPPFVTAFRRNFTVRAPSSIRIHVAADERYDLYLDGAWVGRGNERGAPDVWFYESYQLTLSPGEHVLVARVWSQGDQAAAAEMSVLPGFLLAAEGDWMAVLGTGIAGWEAKRLDGYRFISYPPAGLRGARIEMDGARVGWGYERGEGQGWLPVETVKPAVGRLIDWDFYRQHLLRPATLPPLLNRPYPGGRVRLVAAADSPETGPVVVRERDHLAEEEAPWSGLLQGKSALHFPAHTTRRVLIDLETYLTAFPELVVSGGAGSTLRLYWAEALYHGYNLDWTKVTKGNRNEIDEKFFIGYGDTFLPDGGPQRRFDTLWWMAGRYLEVFVQTADEPLTIDSWTLLETRYPLEMESHFAASDERLSQLIPVLVRGMQMCSNETFFDCPYYEELQYAGDTRLEALTTYMMTRDDRLPRKALRLFDASRIANGLTQARYPCRVLQIIPPFSLWWVMMVRDYALWRGDPEVLRGLLPGLHATLEGFRRFIGADGLLYGPEGWNIMDWVPAWDKDAGVPPDGHTGASGMINWQLVYALALSADLEERLGDGLLAERFRQEARRLAQAAALAFWDDGRGMLADDRARNSFSEHTQCMALLANVLIPGLLTPEQRARMAEGLLTAPDLARATIYFSYYLFETYRELGRVDVLLDRMQLWFGLVDQGFKTTVEMPEPSRSDCHAWGAHPLHHYFATLLGIRPASLGFQQVEIAPQLGPLNWVEGRLVHPAGGEIVASVHREDGSLHGRVRLPAGVTGWLKLDDRTVTLPEGETTF